MQKEEIENKDEFLEEEAQTQIPVSPEDESAYHEIESQKIKKVNNINYNDNLTRLNLKSLIFGNMFQFLGISFRSEERRVGKEC